MKSNYLKTFQALILLLASCITSHTANAQLIKLSITGNGNYHQYDDSSYVQKDFTVDLFMDLSTSRSTYLNTGMGETAEFYNALKYVKISSDVFSKQFTFGEPNSSSNKVFSHKYPQSHTVIGIEGTGRDTSGSSMIAFYMLFHTLSFIDIPLDTIPFDDDMTEGWDYINPFMGIGDYRGSDSFWANDGRRNAPNFYMSTYYEDSLKVSLVPEPSTLAIFDLALMGLASRRFKKS